MEEKQGIKISLSTFLLILALIVIAIMAFFMYKIYNDKEIANNKVEELSSQTNNLQATIDNLQGTIDSISQTINNAENTQNNSNEENSTLNNTDNNDNNRISLETGIYTVDQVKDDEGGVSNSGCGVKLNESNNFTIYMGYGAWHSGIYEIKNNKLICKSTQLEWDGGAGPGQISTNVTFTFEIINKNKLKLSNIDINDKNNEKLVYTEGLSIGMTYSRK